LKAKPGNKKAVIIGNYSRNIQKCKIVGVWPGSAFKSLELL
jgi:hypothetical protein